MLDLQIPDLLAKVDLVTHTDGALHVIDWKTSRSRWSEQKAQENGEQLVLYGATVSAMSVSLNLPVKLHFAIVTRAKKPQVQLIPVPGDSGRLEQLKENIGQVWQAIQSGNFYPSPSPQHCTTCPFRSRCPVFAQPGRDRWPGGRFAASDQRRPDPAVRPTALCPGLQPRGHRRADRRRLHGRADQRL